MHPSPTPVLVVEDDAALRETLIEQLAEDGRFAPEGAATAADAERRLVDPALRFDAVLLDLGLPDGDGAELCRRLRRGGVGVPVLVLTGAAWEGAVVRALDAGADDVVAKPHRRAELLARLRAQLRAGGGGAAVPVGPYLFRPDGLLLVEPGRGRSIRLTRKEGGILRRLARAAGAPVPKAVLLDEVWGYSAAAETHTLETHVHRLRRKIEPDPARPRLLVTALEGYRLAH